MWKVKAMLARKLRECVVGLAEIFHQLAILPPNHLPIKRWKELEVVEKDRKKRAVNVVRYTIYNPMDCVKPRSTLSEAVASPRICSRCGGSLGIPMPPLVPNVVRKAYAKADPTLMAM